MDLSFSFIEILALAGLFQCVSILVYLFFRAGRFSLIVIPVLFFLDLTAALYLDFASAFFRVEELGLLRVRFWLWMFLCPLSILFIHQVSDLSKSAPLYSYATLFPLGAALGFFMVQEPGQSSVRIEDSWMYLYGAVGATLGLPFLWVRRNVLQNVLKEPSGKERYWMIVSLVALTFLLIATVYLLLTDRLNFLEFRSIRTLIGLLFVYLAATYLFRIYPPPIKALTKEDKSASSTPTPEDQRILLEIQNKMEYEKVYLEPSYSRSNLAQELKIPEATLSRLISTYYGRSFPSVLNELRVREACQLLQETDAAINVIAEEVGFNSLASFNRVFKDQMGETASQYRQKKVKEASRLIG
ncbi:MAG: helix-turn-helix transcriptional regulator [Rhodospirillales bacterium]|nr:helix-turn-helix transcriptional regulator [Rhodospirillales bacterium]